MELGLLIACVILSTISLIMSIILGIMFIAKEKSTHTVQMVPVDSEIERANEEFLKAHRKNKWATSEEAIKKQDALYKEEIEAEMPEFSLTDEDKEIFSI